MNSKKTAFAPSIRIGREAGVCRRGFTLLEVMISLMIITLIILIFSSSILVGKKASSLNSQYSQALSLCQHKIDTLRAIGFSRLTYDELAAPPYIDASPIKPPYGFAGVDEVSKYLPNPKATINIQPTTDPDVTLVTVYLEWGSGTSGNKRSSVTLKAQIDNVE